MYELRDWASSYLKVVSIILTFKRTIQLSCLPSSIQLSWKNTRSQVQLIVGGSAKTKVDGSSWPTCLIKRWKLWQEPYAGSILREIFLTFCWLPQDSWYLQQSCQIKCNVGLTQHGFKSLITIKPLQGFFKQTFLLFHKRKKNITVAWLGFWKYCRSDISEIFVKCCIWYAIY